MALPKRSVALAPKFERKIQIDSMPCACDDRWARLHGPPTQERQHPNFGVVHVGAGGSSVPLPYEAREDALVLSQRPQASTNRCAAPKSIRTGMGPQASTLRQHKRPQQIRAPWK
jgi:hypothetical protein